MASGAGPKWQPPRPYRTPARGIRPIESVYRPAARPWPGPRTRRVLTWVATLILAPTFTAVLADLIYGWIHP